jgi:hypothetical protein
LFSLFTTIDYILYPLLIKFSVLFTIVTFEDNFSCVFMDGGSGGPTPSGSGGPSGGSAPSGGPAPSGNPGALTHPSLASNANANDDASHYSVPADSSILLANERVNYTEFATRTEKLSIIQLMGSVNTPRNNNIIHRCTVGDIMDKLTAEINSKHPHWTDYQKQSSMTHRDFLRHLDYFKDNYNGDDIVVKKIFASD